MAQGSFEDDRMICFCWDRRVLIAHIVASEMFFVEYGGCMTRAGPVFLT